MFHRQFPLLGVAAVTADRVGIRLARAGYRSVGAPFDGSGSSSGSGRRSGRARPPRPGPAAGCDLQSVTGLQDLYAGRSVDPFRVRVEQRLVDVWVERIARLPERLQAVLCGTRSISSATALKPPIELVMLASRRTSSSTERKSFSTPSMLALRTRSRSRSTRLL